MMAYHFLLGYMAITVENAREKEVSELFHIYALVRTTRCHLESTGMQFPSSVSQRPEITLTQPVLHTGHTF